MSDRALQRQCFDECVAANWDPHFLLTFAEEIAHLHAELSEAFEAFRIYHDLHYHAEVVATGDTYPLDKAAKPCGVPIEFADVLIGMFYIAERFGFDLLDAVEAKHQFNLGRDYQAERRFLRAAPLTHLNGRLEGGLCEVSGAPKRIQLRRTKGWRKPEGCIVVARPSRWGNPYKVVRVDGTWCILTPGDGLLPYIARSAAIIRAVAHYRMAYEHGWHGLGFTDLDIPLLRGHDLGCYCPLAQPCHADVLLEVTNR